MACAMFLILVYREDNRLSNVPVLEIEDYSLSYATPQGQIRVLDGINLSVAKGEVLGLVGESGSGKSSLAYAILRGMPGQVAHEQGAISFQGQDLVNCNERQLQKVRGNRIAIVFQNAATALNPTQTLGEHVVEVLRRHRGMDRPSASARVLELFNMVGLPDPDAMLSRYAHQVSGGERQRVVLATALACDPDLILFDEPTSALDATTAASMLDLFGELQERTGVAAIFISHDLGVIANIAHRVAVIYGGRIVEESDTKTLFDSPRHPYTRVLLESLPKRSKDKDGQPLVTLRGAGPRRSGLVPACVFCDRCPFHQAECEVAQVRLGPASGGHRVACIRWQETRGLPLAQQDAVPRAHLPSDDPVLDAQSISVLIGRLPFLGGLFGAGRGQVHAVNDSSIVLNRGETLGLVGESGCGKSSLAQAMVGLRRFTGTVKLDGDLVATGGQVDKAYREKIQIIFQNPDSSLNPRHRVAQLLERPMALYRGDLDRRARRIEVENLLKRVRLPAEFAQRYPHELSGGEKQRVAIARAIAARPAVIVCDEITSGLDVSVQAAIVELLREIQFETRVALLFITHDLQLLRHVAHRVAVMYLGEIVEERATSGLDLSPYHPYTEALLSSVPSTDGDVDVRRVRLSGNLPTRTTPTIGCPFDSRCPRRIDERCATQRPPSRTPTTDHHISCHLSEEKLRNIPPIWRTHISKKDGLS
jgi:peptide/nickel transport system ATP-binding protein